MPSSSSCTATNEPTAIVSELNKSNNITISDNGMKNCSTRIPPHKFYGDTSIPMQLLMTQPKVEQTDGENVISKQNDHSNNSTLMGITRKMSRLFDIRLNDEVLVEIDGGKLYLGVVKNIKNDSFLTRFANGTEQWSPVRKLSKFNIKDECSMCVICKEYDDIVQVCSRCHRGFHKKCIKLSKGDECSSSSSSSSSDWHCHKCSNSLVLTKRPEKSIKTKETPSGCYCGEKSDWFMQMLQCARCLQWFHAKCIKCLNFPLYFGDR